MKILGIESAALTASAALMEDGVIIAEYSTNFKKTHSQTLLPMIAELFHMTETEPASLDLVAVSEGPGSFTGLRIGAAAAKGIAFAIEKPIVPVFIHKRKGVHRRLVMCIGEPIDPADYWE